MQGRHVREADVRLLPGAPLRLLRLRLLELFRLPLGLGDAKGAAAEVLGFVEFFGGSGHLISFPVSLPF